MSKKKKTRRRQGVVSWLTSAISLAIGLSGVFATLKVGGLPGLANRASFGMLQGGQFQLNEGLAVYAPMIGGIVFKALAAELTKRARIQAIVPRIG